MFVSSTASTEFHIGSTEDNWSGWVSMSGAAPLSPSAAGHGLNQS